MNKIIAVVALFVAAAFAAEIVPPFGAPSPIYYYANGTITYNCAGAVPTTIALINSTLHSDAEFANPASGTYNGTFYNNDGSFTQVIAGGILNQTENTGSLNNTLGVALRNTGAGLFDLLSFITRFNATGGVAAACPAEATEVTTPFTAIYGFYRAAVPTVPSATLKNTFRAIGNLTVDCSTGAVSGIESILYTVPASGAPEEAGTYNGTFIANDGSFTRASAPVSTPVSGSVALPWFVATGENTVGDGALNGISNITRYETVGGVCPAGTTGSVTTPFEASYGFYTFETLTTSSNEDASTTPVDTISNTGATPSSSRSGAVSVAVSGALLAATALLMA